ncbi:hypothetical protein [Mesorhizobium sp. J428]|uniref:hypothetical protein n=1 Tax=Mesorhizobium sp. J428 TaxID=2898440 RepID=UPI002150DD23|nr:hypothetical protein [Mesorhizobium sp. J428]MCR5857176.1 hypothetical protein [Mesorhizobium sp. J428]
MEASAIAGWLKTSFYIYPLVNAAHIAAAGVVLSSVGVMHLRAAGLFALLDRAATERYFRGMAVGAFVVAAGTGTALFVVNPSEYAVNPAFRIKLILLVMAGANFAAYLALPRWRPAGAAASFLLWPATLLAGRFIGFL